MDDLYCTQHLIPVIPFNEQIMSYGDGSYLYDNTGKKYLDLNAGQFCTVLGHANPEVLDIVCGSAKQLVHTSATVVSETLLVCANNLYEISGDMKASSILLSTGAEVVEFCLRYAKHMQKKEGVVCFNVGYHGLTLGAQSVTFSGVYARPLVQGVYSIPVPSEADVEGAVNDLEMIIKNNDIAAVLLEPIVSVGGMLFPTAEFFMKVRSICDQYKVLLILDECQTGFGRTGDWFAYQTYGFVPDMVATAKGIGLGFPVAAALFRDSIIRRLEGYSVTHYSSHQNDAFAASVINAGIEYMKNHQILSRIKSKGTYFLERLKLLEQNNSHVKNARGCGLMLGIDLFFDGVNDYRELYRRLSNCMMEKGVIVQGTNGGRTLRFLPDYMIEIEDIDYAMDTLGQVVLTVNTL